MASNLLMKSAEAYRRSIKKNQAEIILVIGVILISMLSFAIGYITAKNSGKTPIRIENANNNL